VILQPANKETGPGVLLPLLHIHGNRPDSAVGALPSNHFVLKEKLFAVYVEQAFRLVEADRSFLVLLGAKPNAPDPTYGYIVPR
jgi:mannose-1-phosphate guanylyltransferase